MSKIHFERFDKLLKFLPKSKIKAGDGLDSGKYPFFTSSATLSKFIDTFNYEDESLIFGSGGNASIHYCNQKFATSTDCFVVNQDSEDIDVKYVYYYLKSNIKILEDGFKGAGLKHISKKYISEIKIPLLSLQDQQKIAQLLTQIEAIINKREKSIKLLDELIKSTFLDMFESILTNKKPENLLSFEQMALIDTNMTTDFEKYANFPHIGIASIEKDTGKILDYKLVKDDNLISGKYIFDKRHILYSKIRPNLNKVALPNFKGLLSADGYPILPKDNMNRIFLAHLLRTNFFLNYILGHCDRANIPKVNQKQLSGFSCNIPDKVLQDKFAEMVTQIENTKTIYEDSLNELNNLFGSISQKAFKGELDVSKIELIQKATQVVESQEAIIENKIDYVDTDNNPIFSKDFVKMLINQAGQLTNEKLMNTIKQYSFKDKVSFDDIKKSVIELIENKDIEQIVITTENISGFDKEIGFRIRK